MREDAQSEGELGNVLGSLSKSFGVLALLSGVINVLLLTGSFYMLEVYDRVLPSRNIPTLVALSVLALLLFIFYGLLDYVRSRALLSIGSIFDASLGPRVYEAAVRSSLFTRNVEFNLLRDLDQVRGFVAGAGPLALFDLPWMPFYILICYLFHPLIAAFAVCGALVLCSLMLASEWSTRKVTKAVAQRSSQRGSELDESCRNSSVLISMGILPRSGALWEKSNFGYLSALEHASDLNIRFAVISKVMRMLLQSAVLGLGAYLVVNQQATGGVIIAASIITARALAPLDMVVANWKNFLSARQSWERLSKVLGKLPARQRRTALPRPSRSISVEALSVAPPGSSTLVVDAVTLSILAGNGLGVLGPNGSGKSSLVRAIVGIWPAIRGKIRLDGAALEDWDADFLAKEIGFLPQHVELLSGTIAQNISRFDPEANPAAIVAAAEAAGIHELILRLPHAYETQVGERGWHLSAGQCQRIGLARALYGDPFLVVLDEPDSNLDDQAEEALIRSISAVRARGGVVIVVAHRPHVLAAVDVVMVMNYGRVQAVGPREEILSKKSRAASITASWVPSLRAAADSSAGSSR